MTMYSAFHSPDNWSKAWTKIQERLRRKRRVPFLYLKIRKNMFKNMLIIVLMNVHVTGNDDVIMCAGLWSLLLVWYLIHSSSHCCIATSQPSSHVHHAELFIIPGAQRMSSAKMYLYLKIKQETWPSKCKNLRCSKLCGFIELLWHWNQVYI